MAWGKLDDRFHEHPKVRRLWKTCPAALGLFAMAITYCAGNETDGQIDALWLEERCAFAGADEAPAALADAGLMEQLDDETWWIPSFLDYHPSKAAAEDRRAADAERKARGRQTQKAGRSNPDTPGDPETDPAESEKRPAGHPEDSDGTTDGVRTPSSGPDPTRPDPTRPVSPDGETTDPAGKPAPPPAVVVVPPPSPVRPEIDAACDTLAAANVHVHDRTAVERLADEHPHVDIAQAAINCAHWLRTSKRTVKRPLAALRPFVTADDAPRRDEPGAIRPTGRRGSAMDHYRDMAATIEAEEARA